MPRTTREFLLQELDGIEKNMSWIKHHVIRVIQLTPDDHKLYEAWILLGTLVDGIEDIVVSLRKSI